MKTEFLHKLAGMLKEYNYRATSLIRYSKDELVGLIFNILIKLLELIISGLHSVYHSFPQNPLAITMTN